MNARHHFISDSPAPRFLAGGSSKAQRFLAVALVLFALLSLIGAQPAWAQRLPDQPLSVNALGDSPFADQLSGTEPITSPAS